MVLLTKAISSGRQTSQILDMSQSSPGGERLGYQIRVKISRIAGYLVPDPARKRYGLVFILKGCGKRERENYAHRPVGLTR
jgi:hypothetical protein